MWIPRKTEKLSNRFLALDLPVFLYMGLIFLVSSLPYSPAQDEFTDLIPDVLLHGVEFGILSLLIGRALWSSGRLEHYIPAFFLAILAASAYGAFDEWYQHFIPGRHQDFKDWIADSIGSAISLLILIGYIRFEQAYGKKWLAERKS